MKFLHAKEKFSQFEKAMIKASRIKVYCSTHFVNRSRFSPYAPSLPPLARPLHGKNYKKNAHTNCCCIKVGRNIELWIVEVLLTI